MNDPAESIPARTGDTFQWPPRPDTATPALPAAAPVLSPEEVPTSPWRRAWIGVERELLRPTIEPVERQARDLGWVREPREASCDRCGRGLGPYDEDEFGCSACRGTVSPIDRVVRLGEYTDPLDRWIWALKFQRIRAFGRFLGRELAGSLQDAGVLLQIPPGGLVVQPMPSSRRRRLSRGIDHARVLAEGLAAELRVPVVGALRRSHRPTQRAMAPSDRWSNVQGTMAVPSRLQGLLAAKRVILVDDVRTTGATARAAALALKGQPDARYSPARWGAAEVWQAVAAIAE